MILFVRWGSRAQSLYSEGHPEPKRDGQDPEAVCVRCRDKNTASDATVPLHICRRSGGKEEVLQKYCNLAACLSCVPSACHCQAVAIACPWRCSMQLACGGMTDLSIWIVAQDLGSYGKASTTISKSAGDVTQRWQERILSVSPEARERDHLGPPPR